MPCGAAALGIYARGDRPGDTRSLHYFEIYGPVPEAIERVTQLAGTVIHPGESWRSVRTRKAGRSRWRG
jgi:hypothetical protein